MSRKSVLAVTALLATLGLAALTGCSGNGDDAGAKSRVPAPETRDGDEAAPAPDAPAKKGEVKFGC